MRTARQTSLIERILGRIEIATEGHPDVRAAHLPNLDLIRRDPCWVYPGFRWKGYARIRDEQGKQRPVHVVLRELLIGPYLEKHLDHLCRVRPCCNVNHTRPATPRENLLAGDTIPARYASRTHCDRGHRLAGANLIRGSRRERVCRTCKQEKDRSYYARNSERIRARVNARRKR